MEEIIKNLIIYDYSLVAKGTREEDEEDGDAKRSQVLYKTHSDTIVGWI